MTLLHLPLLPGTLPPWPTLEDLELAMGYGEHSLAAD